MTEAQVHKFIFAPGFSTAAAVTSVSGRGVGMDVVKTNIDQIGGTIDVKSVCGEGSCFTIKIPLTLAIVSALIVEAGGDRFAIPQLSVIELVRAQSNSDHRIERIKDTPVLRLRNKLLPLIHLKKLLAMELGESAEPENGFIVVTQVGNQTFGIVVDGVFHTEEIVVKPMSTQAASHQHVLRQHHSRRRLGDHDHRSERDRAVGRLRGLDGGRGSRGAAQRRDRQDGLAAGVPRRLAGAQGGAALAGHAPGRDRLQEDRAVERASPGPVPRPAHAARAGQRHRPGADRRRPAAPGVLGCRPFDGPGGGRDRRHRRGQAGHPGRERDAGDPRLRRGQGSGDRDHRRRAFPPARLRGLVPPQGDEVRCADADAVVRRRLRRSSATCSARC